ncbi:MAG TPA: hypothetical protein DEB10_01485 [Ruminococcaceae bacterium]|jgi:hypothetical protein|nr:hypothetical protein [Oscillospiraceae bacterium]HCA29468.1 hypothetical protein [Oscillospiraceae bacterium]
MNTEDMRKRNYGLICRSISRFLLVMSVLFILLLQGMTFFIAVDGGYNITRSLLLSLIPIIGPLICGFQLALAGVGSPLILLALFIPCVVTALGCAYFNDQYANDILVHNKEENEKRLPEINTDLLKSGINKIHEPKPQTLPTTVPSKPQPLPVKTPEVRPQTLPIPRPDVKTDKYETKEKKPVDTILTAKTGHDEYDKALQDVLSILNKG